MAPSFRIRSASRGLALALALVAAAPGPVEAQDVAAAEALFEKGVAAMKAGDFEKGCPSIEQSHALDPRPGTLFTLAECERKRGRTATAATRYEDYLNLYRRLPPAQQETQRDRPKLAEERRDEQRKLSPKLTLTVAAATPPGAVAARNGIAQPGPTLGVALPVDPGSHTLTLTAPGRPPAERVVTLANGEEKAVELELTAAAGSPPSGPTPPPDVDGASGLGGQQIAGLVVGGVGLVGLGLGAVFGVVTLGHASDAEGACDLDAKTCSNDDGLASVDAGSTTGTASTVAFIAGGLLLTGGVVLFLAGGDEAEAMAPAPRRVAVVPSLAPTDGGALLGASGRF